MRFSVFSAAVLACISLLGCSPRSTQDTASQGSPAASAVAAPKADGPVNVIWILLDACRADHLSAYGYHRPTSPNIDAFAKTGVVFEHHYAQAPNTLLSVPSYMTGRYNPVFYQDARHLGIWFLRQPPPEEQLVSTIFRENGYVTGIFSASPWYSRESRLSQSFNESFVLQYGPEAPEGGLRDKSPGVFKWLEDHAGKPFFLYLHTLDTHEPRYHNNTRTTWLDPNFPKDRDGELRRWKSGDFSAADQQHITDLYDGGVAYADSTVGEIAQAIQSLNLADRTLFIISADHGEILGQDGETVGHPQTASVDDVLLTPLIMWGPGIPSGRRVTARTENVDIVPTLADLLGLKTTAKFDGRSLRVALDKPDARIHDYIYARYAGFLINANLNRVVIEDNIKFDINGFDDDGMEYLHLPKRPPVLAYAMPDRAGARRAVTLSPADADRIGKLDAERLKPAWDAYAALPKVTPPYFETSTGGSLDRNAVVSALDPMDNLWTRHTSSYLFRMAENELLIADPASENPPALILGVDPVPNGEYKVSAFACSPSADGPPRGISFKFAKYPEEGSTYREFSLPAPEPGKIAEGWFELGTYSVTKGNFVYSLAVGKKEDLTVLGALRFTQVGANVETPDEEKLRQEREQLESVGYGNAK